MAERRSWFKWIGIGCGGLVLLGIVLVAVIVFTVRTLTAGPEQVARDFCQAVAAGDYARAHDAFSAPLKESQPLEVLIAAARARPSLFKIVDTSFTDRSIDLTGAKLAGTATLEAGTTVPVSFTFAKEHDEWKLIAYNIGSAP
jgi:hypothetical protein